MPAYTIQLRQRRRLTSNTYALSFERPPAFHFEPGQYIRFPGNRGVRDYTLINSPEASGLEVCVRHLAEGRFSPTLISAQIGQVFEMEGPLGYFRFQSIPEEAVFIATGTGMAPFLAFTRSGVRGFTLLHGARSLEDLHYQEELRPAAGHYKACVSALPAPGDGPLPPWVSKQRVTDQLRDLSPGSYHFYLCGGVGMIHDAMAIIDTKFDGAPVYTEAFY